MNGARRRQDWKTWVHEEPTRESAMKKTTGVTEPAYRGSQALPPT